MGAGVACSRRSLKCAQNLALLQTLEQIWPMLSHNTILSRSCVFFFLRGPSKQMDKRMHACMHAYIHTYIHIYIHGCLSHQFTVHCRRPRPYSATAERARGEILARKRPPQHKAAASSKIPATASRAAISSVAKFLCKPSGPRHPQTIMMLPKP